MWRTWASLMWASLQQVGRRVWFFPTEGAPGCWTAGLPTALAVAGLETPYPVEVEMGRQPASHSQMVHVQGAHGVQARDRWRWAPPPPTREGNQPGGQLWTVWLGQLWQQPWRPSARRLPRPFSSSSDALRAIASARSFLVSPQLSW